MSSRINGVYTVSAVIDIATRQRRYFAIVIGQLRAKYDNYLFSILFHYTLIIVGFGLSFCYLSQNKCFITYSIRM